MTGFADYERYDALGLAALVRSGKVTPLELLDSAIARVEERNPKVNAVVMRLYDYGRRQIAEGLPDGPFRGVPFLLKDLTAVLAGVAMTRGSRRARAAAHRLDGQDAERRQGRAREPRRPRRDREALRRSRPRRRGSESRDRRRGRRADIPHAGHRQHRRPPRRPPVWQEARPG